MPLARLPISLALGVLATAAIAWTGAALHPDLTLRSAIAGPLPIPLPPGIIAGPSEHAARADGLGYSIYRALVVYDATLEGARLVAHAEGILAGWPLPAMGTMRIRFLPTTPMPKEWQREALARYDSLLVNGLEFPRSSSTPIVLPLRPLWPGAAVDSLLWGTIAWCALSVRTWRHAQRRKRRAASRECIACGHPLAEAPTDATTDGRTCPECGAATAPSSLA